MDTARHDDGVLLFQFQRVEHADDTAAAQEGRGVGFRVNGLQIRQPHIIHTPGFLRQEGPALPHDRRRLFLETTDRRQRPHPEHTLLVDGRNGRRILGHRLFSLKA